MSDELEKVETGNEEEYLPAFELIAIAGDAKSEAFNALELAKKGEYEEARKMLKSADKKFIECHHIQTEMLNNEARGHRNPVNIILIHALDHLTMTTMWVEIVNELIDLYEKNEN